MALFLRYNWPSITWAAFILAVCLMPGRDLPSVKLLNADKLAHFTVYVILALLTYWGWVRQSGYNQLHRHTFLKVVALTFVYGFAVEVLQEWLTADRHFDVYDALANSLGAVAGCLISVKLFAR